MTIAEQIQAALWSLASTVNVWRDGAIAALAIGVVILLWLAASAATE